MSLNLIVGLSKYTIGNSQVNKVIVWSLWSVTWQWSFAIFFYSFLVGISLPYGTIRTCNSWSPLPISCHGLAIRLDYWCFEVSGQWSCCSQPLGYRLQWWPFDWQWYILMNYIFQFTKIVVVALNALRIMLPLNCVDHYTQAIALH